MFGAILREFDAAVSFVDHLLLHSFHFITQHHGIFTTLINNKVQQVNTTVNLLNCTYLIAIRLKVFNKVDNIINIFPFHRVLRAERRFVNIRTRRGGSDSAKVDFLYKKGVSRAEYRAYIVKAAHVVEHHYNMELVHFMIFLTRQSRKFQH